MSPRDYFTEQLLTILVCGGVGFVAIQLYLNDMLKHILAPQFHLPVLIGGVAVLLLVVIRAIAVWREAGQLQPVTDGVTCQQNHVHTAACNHTLPGMPTGDAATTTPENIDDDGHSHDMSWVFARMLILVFPIALFALGIPNSGLSAKGQLDLAGNDVSLDPQALEKLADESAVYEQKVEGDTTMRVLKHENGLMIREVLTKDGDKQKRTLSVIAQAGTEMRFNDLTEAAFDADKRKSYAGQTAILEGRFRKLTDKEFTLFRMKMTCCGSDAIPLKVRIIAPQAVGDFKDFDWVKVRGVIQFIKAPGQERYTPVVVLSDLKDIVVVPVRNEYEF
jgi:uncharacterized membrane protein YcgQ (UPF0703/DUF1980 family)